ncbi:MAG: DNA polymerase I, partial [Chitinophagales bacterium]
REILGIKEVKEKWDIDRIDQVIDMLGMSGDSSDNIPGIPGVGPKTAVKFLKEYGSMEALYEHTDELKGKLKERVEENKEQAFVSKQLATIIIDAPVDLDEEDVTRSEPNKKLLEELFTELEFRALGKRILGDDFSVNTEKKVNKTGQLDLFSQNEGSNNPPVDELKPDNGGKHIENTDHKYHLVESDSAIEKLIALLEKSKGFCFDTETTSLDANNCELVGLSFSIKAKEAYYVPVPEDQDKAKALLKKFKAVFEDEKIEKTGQNLKYDIVVLMWYDVFVKGSLFDTMLAHYLLDPDSSHKMDRLAENFLGYSPVDIESLIGKKGKNQGSMRDVPLEKIKEYASEDADITLQLREKFEPMIKEEGMDKLFHEIETPLVRVLAEMEKEGVALDTDFLKKYSETLNTDILKHREKVFELAGTEFNMDSPKQLGTVLFDKMEIPYTGKKTKTGQYSTNEEKLSKLANEHEIVEYILDYRELTKLKSTYVDALPNAINPKTGRVHSHFLQTVTATGRLSSNNPNLQNIPIRTERGRKVRQAFIPRSEEYVIMAADYSQIELRLVADISGDEAMLNAFKEGQDIHASTAAKLYKVPLEEVTRKMRGNAKMVNFGIIYGISAYGLSQRANIPRREAAQMIEDYFKEYPGIKKYMTESVEFAKKNGYAKTLMGRKRYLRDIDSRNATVRGFAERNAINTPIQGSAADMIKIAMVALHKELAQKNWKSKLTL